MQLHNNSLIFRTFSAIHWNQSEIKIQQSHLLLIDLISKKTSTFSSNAEKLRKIALQYVQNISLELSRTTWSNGLTILFPIIPPCFNISISVR
jgi:hypothetical protein